MNPRELAIGNIVQYINLKGRINLIKQDLTYGYFVVGFASLSSGFACLESPDAFMPIPLDKETLEFCGFKIEHTHSEDGDEIEFFRLGNFIYRLGFGLQFGPHSLPGVQYLHQLQNEYRSLTGQNLLKIERD